MITSTHSSVTRGISSTHMKYFLPSILIFSILTFFFVPAQAEENSDPRENRSITQTKEERVEQKSGNACLETDENCDSNESKEKRTLGREEFRTNVQSRLSSIRAQAEERRVTRQVRVAEDVERRIEFSLDQTMAQFESAILRLSSIADRLENRLSEMHERGLDVAPNLEALDSARIEIALSTEAVDSIARSIDAALTSVTPQNARESLKLSLEEARISLRNAREALLRAVRIDSPDLTNNETPEEDDSE